MVWRKGTRGVWVFTLTAALLIGVSFVRPLPLAIPWGDTTLLHAKLSRGNLCLMLLSVQPNASWGGERPLDHLARRWREIPALAWARYNVHGTFGPDTARFQERGFSCTLLPALALLFSARAAGWVRRRYPAPWRLVVQEVFAPSVSAEGGVFRSWLRRSFLILLCFVAVLWTGVLITSYTGLPGNGPNYLLFGPRNMVRAGTGGGSDSLNTDWPFEWGFGARRGLSMVWYPTCAPLPSLLTSLKNRSRKWGIAGFDWFLSVEVLPTIGERFGDDPRPMMTCGLGSSLDVRQSRCPESRTGPRIVECDRVTHFPCWAPIALATAWPLLAFFCGPWRRARRGADRLCMRCGYDLTGAVSSRCPECGTNILARVATDANPTPNSSAT